LRAQANEPRKRCQLLELGTRLTLLRNANPFIISDRADGQSHPSVSGVGVAAVHLAGVSRSREQMTTASAIRVLCVDDHALIRDALTLKVDLQPDMRMVATAGSGEEGLRCFRRHRPDVTLMDLELPTMSGLDAIRAIRREDPQARIIVLTMYEGDEDIYRAIAAGAATYLLKDTLADDLVRIVRDVHAGGRPLPADVAARLGGQDEQGALRLRRSGMRVLDRIRHRSSRALVRAMGPPDTLR
jgi:DNA-binding NarL/FixJ family response regulator